uniref:DUF4219 domain-containing protein n=1 Tax=Cajanus cajan TaxID=3821 RepID=A0A151R816_CAJCA|nr:hypothetical protein KK1_040036 [Cajanus cajan]
MASGNDGVFAVPQFSEENYHIWIVKMRSCLKSFALWEYVDQDKEVPPLRANSTITQMKQHEEDIYSTLFFVESNK